MAKEYNTKNIEALNKLRQEAAVLKTLTTPEEIPAEWYKKLYPHELECFKKEVLPLYDGGRIPPRDRELLRNKHIAVKNGEFYYVVRPEEWRPSIWVLYNPIPKPRKLTEEDIYDEILDVILLDWMLASPPWVVQNITREEYEANEKAREAKAKKERAPTRAEWREKAKKQYGREISDSDLEDYMWEHETQEQRFERDFDEKIRTKSAFVKGFKIYDHQVHWTMAICATIYVVYNYPIVLYTAIALVFLYYFVGTIYFYYELKDRAKRPFKPDPISRHSEAWQREAWEEDRKRWGFDKEDKDNKSNKKTK